VRYVLIASFCGAALLAEVNPRELVRQSIANGEKGWKQSQAYSCTKLDVDTQFESGGRVKSTDRDRYRIIPVGGVSFQEHIEHNGEPVRSDERQKQQLELQRRERETPRQRGARLAKAERQRSYYKEIPDAFDFKILGEETLPTGPAWVVEATPRPGFQPHSRYAQVFPKMRGKLWIDKRDVQWVKADAVAMGTIHFGWFIASLAKGSHIVIEQTRLPDGAWVPHRLEAKASARTFFSNHNFEEDITYSDYRKGVKQARSTP
jgi:hypothetical protein